MTQNNRTNYTPDFNLTSENPKSYVKIKKYFNYFYTLLYKIRTRIIILHMLRTIHTNTTPNSAFLQDFLLSIDR